MSKALVTSTAEAHFEEKRPVLLVSKKTPALCPQDHNQHRFAGSLEALGMCVINPAPLQGPWVRNSWLSTSKHHVRLRHHTSHISSLRTFCGFQAQFREIKSTSNYILQVKQQLHFARNTEVLAHSYFKSSFSTVRAFLHAHKHFYMQFYITYARQRSQRKYACPKHLFSFFLLLSIRNTTSVDYKENSNAIPSSANRYIEGTAYIIIDKNVQIQDFRTLVLLWIQTAIIQSQKVELRTPNWLRKKAKPTQTTPNSCAG